ncbi:hypothetical protein SDJN03_21526, partial [Cucurbita argyrosperma subsp. sororia]
MAVENVSEQNAEKKERCKRNAGSKELKGEKEKSREKAKHGRHQFILGKMGMEKAKKSKNELTDGQRGSCDGGKSIDGFHALAEVSQATHHPLGDEYAESVEVTNLWK